MSSVLASILVASPLSAVFPIRLPLCFLVSFVVKFRLFLISDHQRKSAASLCFSISAILAVMAILAIFGLPLPLPPMYTQFHPRSPKPTQG
jgi:hypothetical protein